MTALLAFGATAVALLLLVLGALGRLKELHHGYYGAVLLALSPALPWSTAFAAVGAVLVVDDLFQHLVQLRRRRAGLPDGPDFTYIHGLSGVVFDHTSAFGRVALLGLVAALLLTLAWTHRFAGRDGLEALPPLVVLEHAGELVDNARLQHLRRQWADDSIRAARDSATAHAKKAAIAVTRANALSEQHAQLGPAPTPDAGGADPLARHWFVADSLRSLEALALRASLAQRDTADWKRAEETRLWFERASRTEARLDTVTAVLDTTATALRAERTARQQEHDRPPDRCQELLGKLCPSRKTVAVVSVLGTLVTVIATSRR